MRPPVSSSLAACALTALCCCSSAAPQAPTYPYQAPPTSGPPAGLDQETWTRHLKEDLLPYWRMAEAQGTPVGNFPTNRDMNGGVQSPTARKPRMLGRQIFTYCVGYLLTGDESLLALAKAGNRWLLDHGQDKARGGWYADLDAAGNPSGDNPKFAQDFSYTVMGPAMYFFVTGDPESEAAVLATRDLLFDPSKYWDAANGRIRDGMNGALTAEVSMENRGSELVAQLDPITAFLLLVQPVLTDPARRVQMLGDLATLAKVIQSQFWKDGIFWGATGAIGVYHSDHTDFGHILKAYWALTQVDKRLDGHPLRSFLATAAPATLTFAWDAPNGRWAKAPSHATTVDYGSDWWAYAEADNLAATLSLQDPAWLSTLGTAAGHFLTDYVDRTRAAREVVSSVDRTGNWVYPWPDSDTAKCNVWKNGFHTTEHALVLEVLASWLQARPLQLYFAFPAQQVAARAAAATPYTFQAHVASTEDLGALAADASLHKVRVGFDQIR